PFQILGPHRLPPALRQGGPGLGWAIHGRQGRRPRRARPDLGREARHRDRPGRGPGRVSLALTLYEAGSSVVELFAGLLLQRRARKGKEDIARINERLGLTKL